VQIDPDALPDDAAVLQRMLRTILLQHRELHAENDKLRLLVQRLMRHQFGRRSEQLSPDQLDGSINLAESLVF
jgi:transposase